MKVKVEQSKTVETLLAILAAFLLVLPYLF